MNAEQERLLQEPVFRHFHTLCQIPHPSFREEQISRYLFDWACERGLEAHRDAHRNVLIRKPAAAEYENAPGVMLQAHMDMVCEKAPGAAHDFETDPIRWQIEGDRINTNGRTTLGADDGIGVALALSVLEDDSLPHPALEVLFTTAEEEDFSGAAGFDTAAMRSRYLINLDHCCDREFLCGSCGGQAAELEVPVESGAVPEGWIACTLTVSGLLGGHSGEDIHRGHGNAISLLVRLLLALEEQGIPFQLGPVAGGSFRLAIPRDAAAVVCFPAGAQEKLRSAVEQLKDAFAMELSASGAQLTVSLASTERPAWCAAPDALLTAALLSPDGIYQMNETLTGLVDTSDNMGSFSSPKRVCGSSMRSAPPAPASAITYTSGFAGWLRCWAENARQIGSILPGLSSRSPGSGRSQAKPIASCSAAMRNISRSMQDWRSASFRRGSRSWTPSPSARTAGAFIPLRRR